MHTTASETPLPSSGWEEGGKSLGGSVWSANGALLFVGFEPKLMALRADSWLCALGVTLYWVSGIKPAVSGMQAPDLLCDYCYRLPNTITLFLKMHFLCKSNLMNHHELQSCQVFHDWFSGILTPLSPQHSDIKEPPPQHRDMKGSWCSLGLQGGSGLPVHDGWLGIVPIVKVPGEHAQVDTVSL